MAAMTAVNYFAFVFMLGNFKMGNRTSLGTDWAVTGRTKGVYPHGDSRMIIVDSDWWGQIIVSASVAASSRRLAVVNTITCIDKYCSRIRYDGRQWNSAQRAHWIDAIMKQYHALTKRSLMPVTTYHLLPYWVHERANVEMWWEEKGNLKLLLLTNNFYKKAIVFCYQY